MAVSPFRRFAVSAHRRSALTLVEIMVVVSIIVLLLAILLPAISKLRDKAKTDTARAQMQMIAMAIDEYARFWPPVVTEALSPTLPSIKTAIRGLPPWSFADICYAPAYAGANYEYWLAHQDQWLWANECLAWCLTAKVGTGPFLKKTPGGLLENVPGLTYPNSSEPRRRLLDPWETPYFYAWVKEDGMWLVGENFIVTHDPSDRHSFGEELGRHNANGFILISAGPNKRFDFMDRVPGMTIYDPSLALGSRIKTWPGDDIVLGR